MWCWVVSRVINAACAGGVCRWLESGSAWRNVLKTIKDGIKLGHSTNKVSTIKKKKKSQIILKIDSHHRFTGLKHQLLLFVTCRTPTMCFQNSRNMFQQHFWQKHKPEELVKCVYFVWNKEKKTQNQQIAYCPITLIEMKHGKVLLKTFDNHFFGVLIESRDSRIP